jgi:hypothetical protein
LVKSYDFGLMGESHDKIKKTVLSLVDVVVLILMIGEYYAE